MSPRSFAWGLRGLQGAIARCHHGHLEQQALASASSSLPDSCRHLASAAGADPSMGPSTSAPRLPPTLRELQGSLRAPHSPAVSALDSQLHAKYSQTGAPEPSAAAGSDDTLWRHTLRMHKTPARGQIDALRLLSRYNGALPVLRGQTILATVLSVDASRVVVDTGYSGLSELPREDVSIAHVHTSDGSPPLRPTTGDVRPGDVLRLRVDEPYTPYGDMQLTAVREDGEAARRLAWAELRSARDGDQPVRGRVLNECVGGFAVGVAGFVAFLPSSLASRDTTQQVGKLQEFRIMGMDDARRRITLSDPHAVGVSMGGGRGRGGR